MTNDTEMFLNFLFWLYDSRENEAQHRALISNYLTDRDGV